MTAGARGRRGRVGGLAEAPPDDTGEALGLQPSRLTLTIGFGPSLFEKDGKDRFGLKDRRPEALVDLPQFPGDNLDKARSGGDLCVQACADDPQVAVHAIRNLARIGFGKVAIRWSQLGFGKTSSTTPDAQTPRNLLGFKDGTRNIAGTDTAALDKHVWVGARRTAPALDDRRLVPRRPAHPDAHRDLGPHLAPGAGGRLRPRQGRGRPGRQGQGARRAVPEGDAAGRARPARAPRLQRRGHASCAAATPSPTARTAWAGWTRGCSSSPTSATCARGSSRCSGNLSRTDALNEYIQHVGSAVFAVPPGVRDADDWWGRALFSEGGVRTRVRQLPDRSARGTGGQPRRLHPHRLSGEDRTGGTRCGRSGSASRVAVALALGFGCAPGVRLPGADVRGAGGARRLAVDRRRGPGDVDGLLDAAHRAASEDASCTASWTRPSRWAPARWWPPRSWRWAARAWRPRCSSGPSVHAASDGTHGR